MTTPEDYALDTLAGAAIDDADADVLGRIAAVYTKLDPVPGGLIDRIAFGITLDALNAELAELQRSHSVVGVRAEETSANMVTFTSASLTTMVTITATSPELARLDGWITPQGIRGVELRTVAGSRRTESDADGRFVFEDVARGLVQLTFYAADDGRPVLTPALEI